MEIEVVGELLVGGVAQSYRGAGKKGGRERGETRRREGEEQSFGRFLGRGEEQCLPYEKEQGECCRLLHLPSLTHRDDDREMSLRREHLSSTGKERVKIK